MPEGSSTDLCGWKYQALQTPTPLRRQSYAVDVSMLSWRLWSGGKGGTDFLEYSLCSEVVEASKKEEKNDRLTQSNLRCRLG